MNSTGKPVKKSVALLVSLSLVGAVIIVLAIVLPIVLIKKKIFSSSAVSSSHSLTSFSSLSSSGFIINPALPNTGSVHYINAENGTSNLHRVSGSNGLLAAVATNNSDTTQQWTFTQIKQINSFTATYYIAMISTSPSVCTIDSSNSDLCNPYSSTSPYQVWTVTLESGTGTYGTNIFTFNNGTSFLTYVPSGGLNLLTLANMNGFASQNFSLN